MKNTILLLNENVQLFSMGNPAKKTLSVIEWKRATIFDGKYIPQQRKTLPVIEGSILNISNLK